MSGACAEAVIVLRDVRGVEDDVGLSCSVRLQGIVYLVKVECPVSTLWISLYRKSHTTPHLPVLTTAEALETNTLTHGRVIHHVSKAEQFTPLADLLVKQFIPI
jgi:hypothetical protein